MKDRANEEISEEKKWEECCGMRKHGYHWHGHKGHGGNAVYGLGFVGAAVFFIGQATNFSDGVFGFLKALVWPAYLVFEAFKFLAK